MSSITVPIALVTVTAVAVVATAWISGDTLFTGYPVVSLSDTNLAAATAAIICVLCSLLYAALWWFTDRCAACGAAAGVAPVAAVASGSTAVSLLPSLASIPSPISDALSNCEAHPAAILCPVHGYHLMAPAASAASAASYPYPTWRIWPMWSEWTAWPVAPRVPAQPPPMSVPNYDPAGPLSQSSFLERALAEAKSDALPFVAFVPIKPNPVAVVEHELEGKDEL